MDKERKRQQLVLTHYWIAILLVMAAHPPAQSHNSIFIKEYDRPAATMVYTRAKGQAKQHVLLHRLQFSLAQHNYHITSGNK